MVSPAVRFDCAWTTCPMTWSAVPYRFAGARKGGPGKRTLVWWVEIMAGAAAGAVTPDFPKKTKCKPICMPGSSFMHIVT
jgi:hypothetical protein